MSSDVEEWSMLPKAIKLMDVSLIGYGIIFLTSIGLYFLFLDSTVQNLMPIFLCAILTLITWNFRSQLKKHSKFSVQQRLFREWLIIGILLIVFVGIFILIYPITYWFTNYNNYLGKLANIDQISHLWWSYPRMSCTYNNDIMKSRLKWKTDKY